MTELTSTEQLGVLQELSACGLCPATRAFFRLLVKMNSISQASPAVVGRTVHAPLRSGYIIASNAPTGHCSPNHRAPRFDHVRLMTKLTIIRSSVWTSGCHLPRPPRIKVERQNALRLSALTNALQVWIEFVPIKGHGRTNRARIG